MIIFDLDGSLACCEHRRHFVEPTCKNCKSRLSDNIKFDLGWHCDYPCDNVTMDWKPDWPAFYHACSEDKPIEPVIKMYTQLNFESDETYGSVQIWSGRCESAREKTEKWLWKYCGCGFDSSISHHNILKMRPIGDNTPDDQLKERWLDEAIAEGETIDFVVDDRPKVVRMWRRRGVFVFDVYQGDREF